MKFNDDYDPELQDEMNERSSERKELLSEMDEEEEEDDFYCPHCRDQNTGCTWCANYVEY